MTLTQILNAMKDAKVFEAGILAVKTHNLDNLSMLVAVATGKALRDMALYDIYTELDKHTI